MLFRRGYLFLLRLSPLKGVGNRRLPVEGVFNVAFLDMDG